MENVVIIGASGHGGMLADCIEKEGVLHIVGFIDSFKEKGTSIHGYTILGTEDDLPFLIQKHNIHCAILGIGNNWTRKKMVERVHTLAPNLEFVSTVHPSVIIGKNVQIGRGSAVLPGAIVNANAEVGEFCILNTNSSLGHDGKMEDFSSIASGVCTGGDLWLGKYSAVSLGANIIEGIIIGEHSVVGAGALVIKHVNSYTVVYGSPACFIRDRIATDAYLSGDKLSSKEVLLSI